MNASSLPLTHRVRPLPSLPPVVGVFLSMYGNLYIDAREEVLATHHATKVIPRV